MIPVPAVTEVVVDEPDEASSPLMSLALPRLRNIVGVSCRVGLEIKCHKRNESVTRV